MTSHMANTDNVGEDCREPFGDGSSLKVGMTKSVAGMWVYSKGLCPPKDDGLLHGLIQNVRYHGHFGAIPLCLCFESALSPTQLESMIDIRKSSIVIDLQNSK